MDNSQHQSVVIPPPVSAPPPAIHAPEILRQGNLFVVANGCDLPRRCLKCNAETAGKGLKLGLKWRPDPGIVGRLPVVRTARLLTPAETGSITVYLCPTHRNQMTLFSNIFAVLTFLGVIATLTMLALDLGQSDTAKVIGGSIIITTIICFGCSRFFLNASLDIKHSAEGFLWIEGAGEPFLASLPEVPPIS